jgi:hypothetical protein
MIYEENFYTSFTNKLKKIALERQKHYMQLTGQLDQNGKMLVNVNYIELLKEEYGEYMKATKAMDKLEMADALCDILVCEAGVKIQYNCNVYLGYATEVYDIVQSMEDDAKFDVESGLNEVFDNNLARLQYDENGKVILDTREFLDDGTKNPKFGKVKKKDITPNLKQFFRN